MDAVTDRPYATKAKDHSRRGGHSFPRGTRSVGTRVPSASSAFACFRVSSRAAYNAGMAATIHPDGADPATYRGLPALYESINADGEYRRFNCGQAAACTLLTHYQAFPSDLDCDAACQSMTEVEDDHPPDNFGGWFGTSRRRVERICRTHGFALEEIDGEDEL